MEDILDFLHGLMPDSWFNDAHNFYGLTDKEIAMSVQQASDFFNMNAPMNVHEDWTTGVMTGMKFTVNDDILVFNREQLQSMGITDKEGFDLVMTHEGTHRALQGLDTGFNSHQEELCCDYMAGVRAGLNGMDETKMGNSLVNTVESPSHPGGEARVQAIEAGVAFAHTYMESHDGNAPMFSDCLEHFEKTLTDSNPTEAQTQVNLRPEITAFKGYTQADIDWYEHQARISSGSEQAHWLKEAQWARDHIHSFAAAEDNPHVHLGGLYGNATGDYIDDSHPDGHHGDFKGYTQADIDWYEHQARITSGSEQAHWLKEAQWARDHIHG